MTDGERMVWAAAFVAGQELEIDGCEGLSGVQAAAVYAHRCVYAMRTLEVTETMGDQPSDIEAALVDWINAAEAIEIRCSPANLRERIEDRIGRPLRGAK